MAELKLKADSGGGTSSLKGPASSGASPSWRLPSADGSSGQFMKTDGSGVLSFATVDTSIADDSITEAKLDIHAAPSGTDKFLGYTSNGMEWAVPSATGTMTAGSIQGLNGVNVIEWNLSGTVTKIDVQIYKASHDGGSGGSTNTYFAFLLGDSGGYAASGCYDNVNMRLSAADSNASTVSQSRLAWCYFGDAPDNKLSGYASFRLVGTESGNDYWVYDFKGADDLNDDLYLGTGFCNSGISGLSKIKFFTYNNAHDFDMGQVRLNYWTS